MNVCFRVIPALLWMTLIWYLSSQSRMPNPTNLSSDLIAIAGHLTSFGTLLFLFWYATGATKLTAGNRITLSFILTIGYAIVDEIHQSFVPGRQASILDVLTDAIGALIMTGIIVFGYKLFDNRVRNNLGRPPNPD